MDAAYEHAQQLWQLVQGTNEQAVAHVVLSVMLLQVNRIQPADAHVQRGLGIHHLAADSDLATYFAADLQTLLQVCASCVAQS